MDIVERLEKIRLAKNWTWVQLGEQLELSRQMMYYVRSGERNLSGRSAFRLQQLEEEIGTKPEPIRESDKNELIEVMGEVAKLMDSGVTSEEILERLKTSQTIRRFPSSKPPSEDVEQALGGAAEAARLARESGRKRKAGGPSGGKRGPAGGAGGHSK